MPEEPMMRHEIGKPETGANEERRAALKKAGRFVAASAPVIALLLAASAKPKKAWAAY